MISGLILHLMVDSASFANVRNWTNLIMRCFDIEFLFLLDNICGALSVLQNLGWLAACLARLTQLAGLTGRRAALIASRV